MDPEHLSLLRSNCTAIAREIQHAIRLVTEYLLEAEIISDFMKQKILCKETPLERAIELVLKLPYRGPYAFDVFYDACIEHELFGAANILKPGKDHFSLPPDSESQPEDQEEDLPTDWPNQQDIVDYQYTNVNLKKVPDSDSIMKQMYKESAEAGLSSKIYPMTHYERGTVLIINNFEFENKEWNIEKAPADKKAMDLLFQELRFVSSAFKNLPADFMFERLEEQSKKDYSKHDCLVVVIISRGVGNKVFGTDGRMKNSPNGVEVAGYLTTDKIIEPFLNAQSLQNKPKLFFIQTSQAEDFSVTNASANQDVCDAEAKIKYAAADVLLAKSFTPGNKSFDGSDVESWFFQAIFYVFSRYANKKDIMELLEMVSQLVKNRKGNPSLVAQITQETTPLDRQLYFFPGLYKEEK